MTKFQDAMRTECPDCGRDAQVHRLTPTGNFYCLQLNDVGRARYYRDALVLARVPYTCAVRYLKRSPLPTGLGKALNREFKNMSLIGDM